jgi:hypothetical protein
LRSCWQTRGRGGGRNPGPHAPASGLRGEGGGACGGWRLAKPGPGGEGASSSHAGVPRTCRGGAYAVAPRAAGAYLGDACVGFVQVKLLRHARAQGAVRGWGRDVGEKRKG